MRKLVGPWKGKGGSRKTASIQRVPWSRYEKKKKTPLRDDGLQSSSSAAEVRKARN